MAERPNSPEHASLAGATDGEIALRALGGSEAAARELVRRYERPVFNLIDRLVQERPVAEELAQDTFLKVFRGLHTFDPRLRLSAWILRIAHNTALDHLKRRRPMLVSLDERGDDDASSLAERVADPGALPDRLMEQHRTGAAVDAALDRLRPEYREVMVLRYQEGLEYEEIARVTGRPVGTIKTFVHRARRALAEALKAPR
jgi:RNA polymerase sigma-70 factor (ECF subfamily)